MGLLDRLAGMIGAKLDMIHELRGIRVIVDNSRPDIRTADVVARLDESLALIEKHQPWRLAHLRRDLDHIRVMRYACRGAYFPEHRICMVELTFLNRRDIGPEVVAATIVHEGMHARVAVRRSTFDVRREHASDVERQTSDRAREERMCRRAELEFGQSLPPGVGDAVVQRALESLALEDDEVAPAIDWRLAQQRIDDADRR